MPKSYADEQKRKKDEEERQQAEQKVVGQQQKTQPEANKPTGSTSIPTTPAKKQARAEQRQREQQRLENKTPERQARINYNRQQQAQTPTRDTENAKVQNRNERRENTVNRNVTQRQAYTDTNSNNRDLRSNAQKAADRKIDRIVPGYSKSMGAANSQFAPNKRTSQRTQSIMQNYGGNGQTVGGGTIQRLPSPSDLPDAVGSSANQLDLSKYTFGKPSDFSGATIGSRKNAEDDLYNILHGNKREALKESARNDSNTLSSLLAGAGSGALGTLGDLAGISEKYFKGKPNDYEGMTPDDIYNRAVETANGMNLLNYNNATLGSDYDAYKEYILNQMETGDITNDEINKMMNLEKLYSEKIPAKGLKELGADARAINEGYAEKNPISNFAGNMAPMVLANGALSALGVGSEALAAADKINNPALKFLAKQGVNLIPDLITDTGSEMVRNINEGKSKEEIAKDAALNVLMNAGANVAFDYAPKGIKAIADRVNGSNVAKQAAEDVAERVAKEAAPNLAEQTIKGMTNPYSNVADDIIQPGTIDDVFGNNIAPEIDEIGSFTLGGAPRNTDNLIRNNGFRSILRDNEYSKLVDIGGAQGPLDDALSNVIRSVESGDKAAYETAMGQYRQLAEASGIDADRILNRLDRYVTGEISEDLDTELVNSITQNIDVIDAELKKLDAIGVPPTQNGSDWLTAAHEALDDYEKAVFEGGDVTTATDNLNKALGNLDRQAKKLEGYDGAFSAWKGGGTARGDLYSNSSRIPGYGKTEWTDDMINELNDVEDNYHAKPANQDITPSKVPTADSLPDADTNVPKFDEAVTGKNMGKRRTVTNSAVNADIITKDQLQNDPIIKDIANYQRHKNETSLAEAIDNVTLNGETWKSDILSGKKAINSDVAVDTTMLLMRDLDDKIAQTTDAATKEALTNQKNELLRKLSSEETNFGQMIQALAKWNNTADGAMITATKVQQDDVIKPWKSKNASKVKGNSRIAKALADMGNDTKAVKEAPVLTHEQIKEGVRAELEREVGSVENYFNDNDLEFLTQLAEDKSIPVWQITDEIEHKLKNGTWYTLDESIEMPKNINRKLQNALNDLIEGQVRQEKAAPTLSQVTKEVRNTLEKEAASIGAEFTDDDIDYLSNLVYNNATKQEITDALNTKMATGSFGISAETQEQVNALFKQAQNYNPNSKEFVEAQSEALRLLANEVAPDATPLEKFETWRYMAMLGNPKTMLRNYVGNKMFSLVTGISNNIAAASEAAVDKTSKALGGEGIQRTKSVLNPLDKADKSLIDGAGLDIEASRYRQAMGSKYEKVNKDTLKQHRSVWKSSAMQKLEKIIDAGISDYKAVKKKYSTSLAGYLKANGFDSSIYDADVKYNRLKNLSEDRVLTKAEKNTMESLKKQVDALEKARDYALSQAEYATFHEDNAFAKWLTTASNNAPTPLRVAIEGVVPFKKTPANILKSGIQYSPLNAIDSIRKTGKFIYENTGSRKGNLAETYIKKTLKGEEKEVAKTLASEVIDSWAKTLTGGGLLAMGYYLYDKGILNSSDKDTQYQDQLEGIQNYSLKINGKTYTIDWTAPAVMPLLLGAEISKLRNSEGKETSEWYENLDEYLNAVNRVADPIVETSMLSGIKDSLETAANAAKYNENLNIPALLAYNSATGYLTQGIPTLSGQIARTVDNTRRSTYTDKEGVAGVLEKQGRKLLNKIPGLSTLNEPYIDTYGREQKNGPSDNPLLNLGYQMLSPGYMTDINTTNADILSRDIYEKTGNENVLPQWQSSLKIDKKKVAPGTYTEFARQYGNTNYEIRDALSNDEWFAGLSDEEKAEILKDVNNISKNVGQSTVDPEFTSSSKPYMAYSEGGVEGLVNYYKDQQIKGIANESGLKSNTTYSKEIQEDLKNGDTEAAQQKIDSANELDALGMLNSTTAKTYDNAKTVIPTLTAEEFADTYKAMDADNNNRIKQDEVLAYFKANNVSQEDADKYWQAYGNNWKTVPVLEGDEWKAKKATTETTPEEIAPGETTTATDDYSGGSVDIHNRPLVPTSELKAVGWRDAGEGYATVFSSTYSNADETDVRNFTPIVTDNGQYVKTVSPEFLQSYAEEVIDGKHNDYLGLQIGGSYKSIKEATKAAEKLHEDQEKEYGLAPKEDTNIPLPEDLPEQPQQSSDGINWDLNNGYNLKNTKTYQRAKDAGISDSDFANAWWAADTDGNGYMKKSEAQAYVNALENLSDEERNKWFHVLYKGR